MKVDPFVAPIPRKILNDPELRPFFEYFIRWAHDLWLRTGGGDDAVESTQNRDLFDSTTQIRTNSNEADVYGIVPHESSNTEINNFYIEQTEKENYSELLFFENSYFQSISSDITTSTDQTLVCTSALTVTLNANPADGETARIKATNGNVTINGNGKNIDGNSTYTIVVNYECINCVYSALDDEWFIV